MISIEKHSSSAQTLTKLDQPTQRMNHSNSEYSNSVFKDPYEIQSTTMQSARTLPQRHKLSTARSSETITNIAYLPTHMAISKQYSTNKREYESPDRFYL